MFISSYHCALTRTAWLLLVLAATWFFNGNIAYAENYSARLAPLPVNFQTVNTITGGGRIQATLEGNTLSVEGSFSGLQQSATSAAIHIGPLAIPGPAIFSLSVEPSTAGSIHGSATLDNEQIEALMNHSLYVQIHSQTALEGNLRGWLLKVTTSEP